MPLHDSTHRSRSWSSSSDPHHNHRDDDTDDGSHPGHPLEAPVLVYHESARSIVFRDHLRRAVVQQKQQQQINSSSRSLNSNDDGTGFEEPNPNSTATTVAHHHQQQPQSVVQIHGFTPRIQPLPAMEYGPNDEFTPLLESFDPLSSMEYPDDWTSAERHVVHLLRTQHATVKTLKNSDWTAFLQRFQQAQTPRGRAGLLHKDIPASTTNHRFNAFVTSTSLLPPGCRKMRSYGQANTYTTGVVFPLPQFPSPEEEERQQKETETWAWPAGYAAKTEYNIDGRGRLINGRQEALVSLHTLRRYNEDYVREDNGGPPVEYIVGQRRVSGLSVIPYNEVFLRVGGPGRLLDNVDVSTGEQQPPSFHRGVGLPIALFCRTATYGHLITLMRTRARLMHTLGESYVHGIPLLYLDPDRGVRVLTEDLQRRFWKIAANNLNPFQNPSIAHKTTLQHTEDKSFSQKVDELIELDESIRELLTPEELAHIAGGFGATDESVAQTLQSVMLSSPDSAGDSTTNGGHQRLQAVVNEGLEAAVRAGDYHTSRQLLILYSLVASMPTTRDTTDDGNPSVETSLAVPKSRGRSESLGSSLGTDVESIKRDLELVTTNRSHQVSTGLPAPPPPPPLDTDRLRSATNSDGLLAVLGAAQVLKAMQDGGAKKRTLEAVSAVEEWVTYGEQNVAFRISSWYDQRAAQGDLKIATSDKTNFMAFVSNKAVTNRKNFAKELRQSVAATDFGDMTFLQGIMEILSHMHSPCLRLELLQYLLGLDNRYSVAHVSRSVELAATCLGISLHSAPSSITTS